jgi:hypothetical protein
MFIYPSVGASRLSASELRERLAGEGLRADLKSDGDLVWLGVDDNSDLRCTIEGAAVTSAVLEGVPNNPRTIAALEQVFGAVGWELADEDEADGMGAD